MGSNYESIDDMTRSDFWELPWREWREDIGPFDSLVILPTRRKHDSGFRCMDFVACLRDRPLCRLSGCSDVIHIDGIGGYGNWNPDHGIPRTIAPKGWSIDCLGKSGLLRIFLGHDYRMTCGPALSSFEIYGTAQVPANEDTETEYA